jgi:hypothetical protein
VIVGLTGFALWFVLTLLLRQSNITRPFLNNSSIYCSILMKFWYVLQLLSLMSYKTTAYLYLIIQCGFQDGLLKKVQIVNEVLFQLYFRCENSFFSKFFSFLSKNKVREVDSDRYCWCGTTGGRTSRKKSSIFYWVAIETYKKSCFQSNSGYFHMFFTNPLNYLKSEEELLMRNPG